MKLASKIVPPNSLLFIMDKDSVDIPMSMASKLISATNSSIAVGTLSEMDGETEIVLTDEPYLAQEGETVAFEGCINTPSKRISVSNSEDESILVADVNEISFLRIIVNHQTEPDRIVICLLEG